MGEQQIRQLRLRVRGHRVIPPGGLQVVEVDDTTPVSVAADRDDP